MPIQAKSLPAASQLWERYTYNPLTGELFGKKNPDKPLGIVTPKGYIRISVRTSKHQLLSAHRVVWKWVTGQEPAAELDHVDRNRSNNQFWNLRPADRVVNRHNRADYQLIKRLTPQILRQFRAGWSNRATARSLGISEGSVRNVLRTCL